MSRSLYALPHPVNLHCNRLMSTLLYSIVKVSSSDLALSIAYVRVVSYEHLLSDVAVCEGLPNRAKGPACSPPKESLCSQVVYEV